MVVAAPIPLLPAHCTGLVGPNLASVWFAAQIFMVSEEACVAQSALLMGSAQVLHETSLALGTLSGFTVPTVTLEVLPKVVTWVALGALVRCCQLGCRPTLLAANPKASAAGEGFAAPIWQKLIARIAGSTLVCASPGALLLAKLTAGARRHTAAVGFTLPSARGIGQEEAGIAGLTLIFCSPCFLRPAGAACFIWAQGAGNGLAVLAIQSVARVAARTFIEGRALTLRDTGLAGSSNAGFTGEVLTESSHKTSSGIALRAMVAHASLLLGNTCLAIGDRITSFTAQRFAF